MFGSAISALGSIAGGLLSNSAASDANATNAALTREQIAYQKELHQNQLQWRVADAQKAGLHPLAGLGVSSYSFSPVSSTQSPLDYSWLGEAGQNINTAIQRGKDAKERKKAEALAADTAQVQMEAARLQNDALRFQIEGQMLDNDVRRMEIASRMRASQNPTQIGPPAPSLKGVPSAVIDGQEQSSAYGTIPEFVWLTDERGEKTGFTVSPELGELQADTPVVGNLIPRADAWTQQFFAKNFGTSVGGLYWHPDSQSFRSGKPKSSRRGTDYKKWLSRPSGYWR